MSSLPHSSDLSPGSLAGQILIIDNYDSFTYNLVQYLRELGGLVQVIRNDATTVAAIALAEPAAVVISPGPGVPEKAGICVSLVRQLGTQLPILGVCLGHQAIGLAYGARVIGAPQLAHGKVSPVYHDNQGILQGLPNPFLATRYHSLVIAPHPPPELEVTAWSQDDLIMAVRHRRDPVVGVQFHPESIGTPEGHTILANFLTFAGLSVRPVIPTLQVFPRLPN